MKVGRGGRVAFDGREGRMTTEWNWGREDGSFTGQKARREKTAA